MARRKRRVPRKRREAQDAGYRSGFEHTVAQALEEAGMAYEYEPFALEWYPDAKWYTPDFVLQNGVIVEVKGRLTVHDRTKMLKVREQHPDLDIRFVFAFDNKLNPKSKTRYSDWCDKHGFLYAFGTVPEEWDTDDES